MPPLVVIILLQSAIVLQISTSRQIFRKLHHKPRGFKELASSFPSSMPFDCCIVRRFGVFPPSPLDCLTSFALKKLSVFQRLGTDCASVSVGVNDLLLTLRVNGKRLRNVLR